MCFIFQIVHADFDEEDNAFLLTVSFRKPGASLQAAKEKPKPKPKPVAEPPPKPKPSLKGTATAIGAAKKIVKKVEKKEPVKPKPEPKKDPFFVTEEYEVSIGGCTESCSRVSVE